MARMMFLKIGCALAAVLALAGCASGYQYRAVASGGDYYLADEVATPYYLAPYGTLGYGWPGGWYGNVGLGFGSYYGLGGFYGPFYRPVYAPGAWYGLPRYGYRYPHHYRPRPRHPGPTRVERPHERRVLPPREHRRDGSRRPQPRRDHPLYRRQDQAVVPAEDRMLPGRGWRNRMPEAGSNGSGRPAGMNGRPVQRAPGVNGNRPRRAGPMVSGMQTARPAQVVPRGFQPDASVPQPRQLRAAPSITPVAPARPPQMAPAPRPVQAVPSAPGPATVSAPRPPRAAPPPPRRAAAPAPRAPGSANHRMRER